MGIRRGLDIGLDYTGADGSYRAEASGATVVIADPWWKTELSRHRWKLRGAWNCAGCDSSVDVWAMPIGSNRFDVRLCLPCRRELVRRILHVATSTDGVIILSSTTDQL